MNKQREFYTNFGLDDFINDADFVNWVKYPNAERNLYWNEVISSHPDKKGIITQAVQVISILSRPVVDTYPDSQQKVWLRIEQELKSKPFKSVTYNWTRIAAAAIVFLTISAGIYLIGNKYMISEGEANMIAIHKNDIKAGSNKAILTLNNGQTIDLNNATNGQVATQSGISIEKTKNGELVYTIKDNAEGGTETVGNNIVSTPRGGHYQLILPDQTHVWLNAASSIKFPVSFLHANKRVVEINGEAYFEVFHNKKLPFVVRTANQEIEVLGTHFNINSYSDEGKTVTTLAEGVVKVSPKGLAGGAAILKPGQQSVLIAERISVLPADVETVLAWKNGRLEFKDADIQTIMREVSRWYNIDVIYKGKISERRFVGSIPRQSNLSTLLELLRLSNINFKIEDSIQGKKLIVSPDE
ncbi:FecR domain-containing protein [Pedobacter sp. MC2016-14]|uniref:FecR family protein n=1 Tax=Pedobacter sp. MC2016-14 TaxID=2897327 RepID=UPI001E42E7AC|nr:FecR family protein [Pedobacter sp. MC2016-14]MCD0488595.1 FecR domain-containing protein [Pedobacter sp. MC2016-14]